MQCPKCSNQIIEPGGMNTSGVAVVGEFPSLRDIQEGVSFTGLFGQVLRNEFDKASLTFDLGMYTNLWLHKLGAGMYDDTKHFMWHRARLVKDLNDIDHVLMLGSELARVFMKTGVKEITGLEVSSTWLPPQLSVTFLPLPSSVLHGGVGEFRLGVEKFASRVSESVQ